MSNLKPWLVGALACCLALAAGPAAAAANPFQPKLPFDSAVIVYQLSGNTTGTETLYIQGQKQARRQISETKVFGFSGGKAETLTITTPEMVTTVDFEKKEATQTGNMQTYLAQEYEKLSPAEKKTVQKNAQNMGQNMLQALAGGGGAQPQRSEGTFMGKPVEIVTVMGMTSHVWKGSNIPLKTQGSIMGMEINSVATDIKVDSGVPADAFQVPAGFATRFDHEADQQQREMAKQIMASLKDPDFGKNQGGGLGAVLSVQPQGQQPEPAQADEPARQHGAGDQVQDAVNQGMKALKGLFD